MDPKDRRLLGEVLRWARSQGWRPTRTRRLPHLARGWTDAPADWRFAPEEGANSVVVGRPGLSVHRPGWSAPATVPIDSVTQAVDLLVALRVLPAVFSSAFRSGQSLGLYLGGRMPCAHEAVKVGAGA